MPRRRTRTALLWLSLAVLGTALTAPAPAQAELSLPPGFQARTLVSGLDAPTGVAFAPDGRTFVIEKGGVLKVANPGATTAKTVLDITDQVHTASDRGLLGIAVDSSFATNGYLYLLYTYDVGPPGNRDDDTIETVSQLMRVKVGQDNSVQEQKVILGSYTQGACPTPDPAATSYALDCIPSNGTSHSIGTVRSAPDGTLYLGSGDSSDYGSVDPLAFRTYNENSYAGKILHVDRNGNGITGHPFCPGAALTLNCSKIWAKGFRNPYRFELRPGGAGLLVGDVGWTEREEIDLISTPGKSYGWPCYEGNQHTPGYSDDPKCGALYGQEATPAAQILPAHEWRHSASMYPNDWPGFKEVGQTALGGPTYEGTGYPAEYRGTAFYGDFGEKTIRRLIFDGSGRVARTEPFATGSEWMVDLEAGPTGNLVTVDIAYGVIREIVYSANRAPKAVAAATPRSGTAPLNVSFDATGSTDPDNDTLSCDWDFGDGTAHSSASKPSHRYSRAGGFTATLTVTDGRGGRDSATTQITPGESRPTATISAPLDESTYQDGAALDLTGSATDAQDGELEGSTLEWRIVLHHDGHIHPGATKTGGSASFTASTDHDADSFYEVTLTATDSAGLKSDPKTIQLRPETTSVELKSDPAGAPMTYAGRNVTAPFTAPTAVGFKTELSASPSFTRDGRTYVFQRWSDGGSRGRASLLVPPGGIDLTASYSDAAPGGGAPTTPPAPGAAPPAAPAKTEQKDRRAYWKAIRATKGLRAAYGLGDRGATARPARGSARGRYRGRPRRTRALVKGSLDGAARHFGGQRDSLGLASSALSGRPRLSVELWLKFGRPAARTILASPRTLFDELTLSMTAAGRPVAQLSRFMGKTRAVGPKMKANAVHHVVVTCDGRRLRLYVDGVLARARPGTAPARWRLRRGLTLARGPADDHLRATLDELALYDSPLAPATIKRHYDAGR